MCVLEEEAVLDGQGEEELRAGRLSKRRRSDEGSRPDRLERRLETLKARVPELFEGDGSYEILEVVSDRPAGPVLLVRRNDVVSCLKLRIHVENPRTLNEEIAKAAALSEQQALCECRVFSILRCNRSGSAPLKKVGVLKTCIYYDTEYCGGGDLRSYVDKFELTAESRRAFSHLEIESFAFELLIALNVVHRPGYVHRDVKTENIFIDGEGFLRLGDFGFAERLRGYNGWALRGAIGTPYYMAPEVWYGEPYGTPADMYSLGVVLYELYTGRRPYAWSFLGAKRRPPDWSIAPVFKEEECPLHMQGLILALTQRDARERPTAAEVLLSDLGVVLAGAFAERVGELVLDSCRANSILEEASSEVRALGDQPPWISSVRGGRKWRFATGVGVHCRPPAREALSACEAGGESPAASGPVPNVLCPPLERASGSPLEPCEGPSSGQRSGPARATPQGGSSGSSKGAVGREPVGAGKWCC